MRNPAFPTLLSLPLVFLGLLSGAACRTATATDVVTSADVVATAPGTHVGSNPGGAGNGTPLTPQAGHALAAFSEGCFWGSEDTFRHVAGVTATAVGYTGGHTKSPTYEDVCDHTTGHAETVLIEFDPQRVTYSQLLAVFWNSHDPTTLNRQGPDFGDQYRSSVWTFSAEEDAAARASMAAEQKRTQGTIVTEIKPIGAFYIAEGYHQQYDEKTGRHSCPLPRHATTTSG
jgi:peptide-methionine (S)-S-oxide reductase